MDSVPLSAIYSSPLERTMETAQPLAKRKNLAIRQNRAFGEIDFGVWQGKDFWEIEQDPTLGYRSISTCDWRYLPPQSRF